MQEWSINLHDKDAWDDTALIKAYDAAVRSYQVCRRTEHDYVQRMLGRFCVSLRVTGSECQDPDRACSQKREQPEAVSFPPICADSQASSFN